jgi:hypothetical protein
MSATPPGTPLSKNAVLAGVLLRLLKERPYVRRGFDALIDLGLVAASGENIAVTRNGLMFFEFTMTGARPAAQDAEVATRLLARVDDDERLSPSASIDELQTLHGRLDGYRERKRTRFGAWQVLLALLILGALWVVWRIVR